MNDPEYWLRKSEGDKDSMILVVIIVAALVCLIGGLTVYLIGGL